MRGGKGVLGRVACEIPPSGKSGAAVVDVTLISFASSTREDLQMPSKDKSRTPSSPSPPFQTRVHDSHQ